MPESQIDTGAFARLRGRLDRAADAVRRTELRLAEACADRERLTAAGAPDPRLTTAEAAVRALLDEHAGRAEDHRALLEDLRDLSKRAVGRRDPSSFVRTLDGSAPICMLPVRVETRFFTGGTELRIRIYPDQVHLDAHEPELIDAEIAAGERYWQARWQADDAGRHAAWAEITGSMDPRRARWITEQLAPTNPTDETIAGSTPRFPTPPRKSGPWTRPVHATALPDRWLAVGYRGGAELFRKWGKAVPDVLATTPTPDPNQDPDDPVPVSPDEPPGDDPMRWLVDYPAAVDLGMGITVTDTDLPSGQSLRGGLDRLVVTGVDWTLTPEAAAARLAALLDAHRVTDGMAFVAAGTATNNTTSERSGASTARAAQADDLDPGTVVAGLGPNAAAPRLARGLGLGDRVLDSVPRAGLLEAHTSSLLHQVLWMSTLGHYLDELLEPVLDDNSVGLARDHVTRWLHPGGPFATVRIGKQPYGVLPVMAPGRFAPDRPGGFEDGLDRLLAKVRWLWTDGAARVPRMGRTNDPDTDLLELLQRNPMAMVARFRKVLGPAAVANTRGMGEHAAAQAWSWRIWGSILGWSQPPALATFTADPKDHPLPVPWVQVGPLGDGPLAPNNYLGTIAATARARGGRADLESQEDADTVLQALVAHAALEELGRATENVIISRFGREATVLAAAKALRTDEMYGVLPPAVTPTIGTERLARHTTTVSTPRQLANVVIPDLSGTLSLADHVADLVSRVDLPERPEVRTLAMFLSALEELATRPAAEIDRAFRGFLDAASHRVDAWVTSLAARRLDAVRDARPTGVHLGGYGWVEDLAPDTTPDSLGYVHAPSLPHAATAAILRSGHLSHRDGDHETLDIQLSSDRVQRAMPVIEGAAAGQPIAALIGYRFERLLRESDDRLARFILPARRYAPLRPSTEPQGAGPQEAIAARDVVDGVRLLERWEDDRAAVLAALGVPAAERPAVSSVLDDLALTWDAVGDVLVSEAVYQTVLGNMERAGAALAAVDKQQRPPEPEVVRTPRSGVTYTQKVFVAVDHDQARAPWQRLRDVRAKAAPMLDTWVASLLPDPGKLRFWGILTSPGVGGAAPTDTPLWVTATDLSLSALSLVLASVTGAASQTSELESRVAQALTAGIPLGDGHELTLLDTRPDPAPPAAPAVPGEVNLGAARALLGWMRELLGGSRPLTAEDLALPGGDRATGVDLDDLGARADGAASAVADAADVLDALRANTAATAAALRGALRAAAALGIAEAVPRPSTGGTAAARAALRAQVEAVTEEVSHRHARLEALGPVPPDGPDATPPTEAAQVAHHSQRLAVAFGDAFSVVPRIRLTPSVDVPGLNASLADRSSLTAGDDVVARSWVDRLAMVRPGVDRLARVLMGAEVLGAQAAGAEGVAVAQLPHTPGQRWLALPFDDTGPASAAVALTIHAPGGLDPARPITGVVCDEWVEVIPNPAETTGVTFHYDAPGARAPQCILLAVPPQPHMAQWDLDTLLETILEAAALTRSRGVTAKDMRLAGAQLPMVYLPQNFTRDRPSVDFGRLLELRAATIEHASVLGKGWSL